MVNKFGTFQKTAKQADCDFYAAVYGKEESQKSLGSQITIINRDCGNGSLGCQWIFSDPPMNIFFVFHVNTEQSVNLPHYGGMNKVKFMETDDGYDVTMESEKYGKTHLVEKYSDEGITHVCKIYILILNSEVRFIFPNEFGILSDNLFFFLRSQHIREKLTPNFPNESLRKMDYIVLINK